MGTKYPEIWNALAAKFHTQRVKERPAGGRKVKFITARTVANRLDQVLGFEHWWDDYQTDAMGGDNVVCRLTIRLPDGSTVTKCDSGSPGNTGDEGTDEKGAFSDAFKRAAAKFGVGRYLYGDGIYLCPSAEKAPGPPPMPEAEAGSRPGPPSHSPSPAAEAPPPPADRAGGGKPPRTGRQLFAWAKDQEARHEVGLIKYLNGWAKLQDFPGRMVDWTDAQAVEGHAEAVRKLRSLAPPAGSPPLPFSSPGGFREWAGSRLASDKAHAIGTELRFPGSWLQWTQSQCSEVYLALMEHEAEDVNSGALVN